jgi:hypothetical protein
VAKALFQAMDDDGAIAAEAYTVSKPGQSEVVEAMTKMMAAMRRASDTAIQRFGDEFSRLAGGHLDTAHINPKDIDEGSEAIVGDTATERTPCC